MIPQAFRRSIFPASLLAVLVCFAAAAKEPAAGGGPANLFFNPSFENGRDLWQLDHAGQTTATLPVDDKEAAAGRRSAVVSIDTVDDWGIQFGQTMEAPAAGKTYTFAVLAKASKSRSPCAWRSSAAASPYDRAAGQPAD